MKAPRTQECKLTSKIIIKQNQSIPSLTKARKCKFYTVIYEQIYLYVKLKVTTRI